MKIRKRLGIKTQLFIGFGIFTAIIVCILWVFQISLLNTFYKFIKQVEIKQTAKTVVTALNDSEDSLSEALSDIVRNTNTEILVTDASGNQINNMQFVRSNFLYMLSPSKCKEIFTDVSEKGGFDLIITNQPGQSFGLSGNEFSGKKKNDASIIYLNTVVLDSGQARLIILKTTVTPVDSTVTTLKVQLWCLTFVMLILSFILALVISRKLSKPLISMNDSAKILAQGNYDIEFQEKGSQELRELASTLNYASHELSKVERLRRELIANVSHDLRTPLTMITGYSEVMRDIPGENTPENIQIIIDESNRLTRLVNDMLDISKIESGSWELELSKINLTENIDGILSRFDKLTDYSINFLHGDDVFVIADELKISQVLYNLVSNAITHTGNSKVVTIRQSIVGSKVKIEVIDKGQGIPEDKLKDIWERYYKVDTEHKRSAQGTGLGLSIVKKILDLHGGEYGVVSREDEGSNFWFTLELSK